MSLAVPAPRPAVAPRRGSRRLLLAMLSRLLSRLRARLPMMCWALGATLLAAGMQAQGASPASPALPTPAIVVWDFDNQSPPGPNRMRSDFLQRALSENLSATLLQVPGLQLVERQRLKDLLAEQQLAAGALSDEDTRLRLGRIVGASRMVFGGFFALGDVVQVHLRLIDTATSRVLYSDEAAVPLSSVMQAMAPVNRRLLRKLDADGSAAEGRVFPAALWQAYDAALALADAGDFDRAVLALQALLVQDKSFAPAERQLVALLDRIARR